MSRLQAIRKVTPTPPKSVYGASFVFDPHSCTVQIWARPECPNLGANSVLMRNKVRGDFIRHYNSEKWNAPFLARVVHFPEVEIYDVEGDFITKKIDFIETDISSEIKMIIPRIFIIPRHEIWGMDLHGAQA